MRAFARKGAPTCVGVLLLSLGLVLSSARTAEAAEAAKYIGGMTANVTTGTTEAQCDGNASDGIVSAPCLRGIRMKLRVVTALPTASVGWLQVEGQVPGSADRWQAWQQTTPVTRLVNVAGATGSTFYNQYGDVVPASCVTPFDTEICRAYPYHGVVSASQLTSAGIKDSGWVPNTIARWGSTTVPRVRFCVRVAGVTNSAPYECTAYVTPTVNTDYAGGPPDPGTPGLDATQEGTTGGAGTPTDPGGTTDPSIETACGAWYHLGCYLEKLFKPTVDWETKWGEVETAVGDSYPIGPLVWAGDLYGSFKDGLAGEVDEGGLADGDAICNYGPSLNIPAIMGEANGQGPVKITLIYGCPDGGNTPAWISSIRHITKPLSTVVILGGFLFAVWRLFTGAKQGGSDE